MIWLIITSVILLILLVISLILLYKFARYTMLFEDNINESIEKLEACHNNIAKLLNRPLLIDTPEVKWIMQELRKSQDIIIDTTEKLSRS